jgi:glycosyltransferase involved in cell wall biosynthesis
MQSGGLQTKGITKQSQPNMQLITVVTVVRNGEKTLEQTMLSVINQTYANVEYIVVDGASTDGTLDIIRKYEDRIDYWMSEPDEGIYDAMNKGIDLAAGEWINFMNSGDSFYENNIIRKIFEKDVISDDIVYGDVLYVYGFGNFLKKAEPLNLMVKQMVFCHQATFVRFSLMQEIKFDTSFKSSGDYNFFYQCYKLHKSFRYVPFIIATYKAEEGMSRNYKLVKYEDAHVYGINYSLHWKVKYFFNCLLYDSKQIVKRIIPQGIVKRIKDHNIKHLMQAE